VQADHGLGLTMTAELVDELRFDLTPEGTVATIRHRLSRPARLLTADRVAFGAPQHPGAEDTGLLVVRDQPRATTPTVALDGPLDGTTAAQLEHELNRLTLGGTHPLTLDLTGVTHLASAAVAILHRAVSRGADNGAPLALLAPAGTTAAHVLAVVNLARTPARSS
jgi:anti-anti-sigma factor